MAYRANKKKPELLAPAGSLSAGLTAIDYGADAVYAGLPKFNARERTENFTLEEMSKLIAYAHKHEKKVYITFNTLIKESEVTEVAEQLCEISKLNSDAVIVQDLGVLYMLKNYFPWMPIHASTQMGIHNSAGVNLAGKMGISRVVLERQVTLNELRDIKKNTSLELEVFIHGALCCSMSGNCLFSSWLGGFSGNRGKCKQPCRKLYHSDTASGYLFSTKDLCSIDLINVYKELGIASLKIEGRLRKADYVRSVVSAYRTVLDSDDDSAVDKAKQILLRTSGRKWSEGFRTQEAFKNVVEPDAIGISGQACGKVLDVRNDGFKTLLKSSIHIGDRVRVQPSTGEEGPAFTITDILVNGKLEKKCCKGTVCFIKTDRNIPKHGIIYKIGESGGDLISVINNLPLQRHKVDLNIGVTRNGIKVIPLNLDMPEWVIAENFAEALKNPVTKEQIAEEFASTRSERYESGTISVSIEGKLFIPSSVLKAKRRDFWTYFIENVDEKMFFKRSIAALEDFKTDYASFGIIDNDSVDTGISVFVREGDPNPFPEAITTHALDDFAAGTKEIILPEYCFEYDLKRIERKIRIAVEKGFTAFRVTSLYGFELLRGYKGIKITTSYPLPVSNSLAAKEIRKVSSFCHFKLQNIQTWIELEKPEILNLRRKTDLPLELYYYGKPHLLITRAYISAKNEIREPKSAGFVLKKDLKSGLCLLYSEKVFKAYNIDGMSLFFDLANADIDEHNTSSFNLDFVLT